MSTPLTDRINALTAYSNQKTGASDTTLSDAVTRLVAGYGGGNIENGIVFTELNNDGRPILADIYGDVPSYAFGYLSATNVLGSYLTNVTFKGNTTKIGDGAFQKNAALTELIIPDSVTTIGSQVVRGCSGIVSYIHENAGNFYGVRTPASRAIFSNWIATSLETLQLGAIGKPVTALSRIAFDAVNFPATANVIIYCSGEDVDTYLEAVRVNVTKATVTFKASEATTYNSTSYAAGDTILTDVPSTT